MLLHFYCRGAISSLTFYSWFSIKWTKAINENDKIYVQLPEDCFETHPKIATKASKNLEYILQKNVTNFFQWSSRYTTYERCEMLHNCKRKKTIDPQKIMFPCKKLSILYFAKKISTEINLTALYKFLALFLIHNFSGFALNKVTFRRVLLVLIEKQSVTCFAWPLPHKKNIPCKRASSYPSCRLLIEDWNSQTLYTPN